ncbi:MAG: AIPR family protein, partial [Dissulfurispiraceae bacterium]
RRFPDPLSKDDQNGLSNLEHHLILCKAVSMPEGIPFTPNPRAQDTDKTIYKEVRSSLLAEDDPTFHLKNKGITIIAHSVDYSPDKQTIEVVFDDEDGIVDGGHTYRILIENKDQCPDSQYVKCEIITGVPKYMVASIAQGLNTAVQVEPMSLHNLAKKFDWIGEELKDMPYAGKIAYRENEDRPYTIRDIISLMELFNIELFPDGSKHPKTAYVSKAVSLDDFVKNPASFKKLRPLLKDILELYDYMQIKGRTLYNNKFKGRGAALAFYQTRKRGEYEYVFSGGKAKYRLYDGALYPILGSFRFLVEYKPDKEEYCWKVGTVDNVKKLFDQIGGDLIHLTKTTSDSRGKNPNAIGKDENHWALLYNTVALAFLQKQGV